jgi:CBS domain-containing protein
MKAQDLMSRPVETCRSHESLNEAVRKMWEADIGAVVVVDDKNRVAGMVTDRDVCIAAYTQGRPLAGIVIAETMSESVITCGPADDIADAERLMKHHKIHRIPVIDQERRPVGIITLRDLARAGDLRGGAAELMDTFAEISQPRRPVSLGSTTRRSGPGVGRDRQGPGTAERADAQYASRASW